MGFEDNEAVGVDKLRPAPEVFDGTLDHVARRDGVALGIDVDSGATEWQSPLSRLAVLGRHVRAIMIEERPHVEHAIEILDAVRVQPLPETQWAPEVTLHAVVLDPRRR